jgi:hypothetical protein
MDVVVLRCGEGQGMREEVLQACGLVKTGGALSTCVAERYPHIHMSTCVAERYPHVGSQGRGQQQGNGNGATAVQGSTVPLLPQQASGVCSETEMRVWQQ